MLILTPAPAQAANDGLVTVFQENFENPNWSCDFPWDQTGRELWVRGDANPASDFDSWCFTVDNPDPSAAGSHSAWCSTVGNNSIYLDMYGQVKTNKQVMKYDANMTAFWRHSLTMSAQRGDATLTFRYWAMTSQSSAAGGYDHLQVSVSSDNSTYNAVWTQPSAVADSWRTVTVTIPANTRTLSFDFISGPHERGRSPADGAYVDNILVTQREETSWSFVQALPAYSPSAFNINISIDPTRGTPSEINLYYRTNQSGAYSLYTDADHPGGGFAYGAPITFDSMRAAGEKSYQFYSVAAGGGVTETAPSAPDAATTVDANGPNTSVTLNGTLGWVDWYRSAVEVAFNATDIRSGVQFTQYNLDHEGWRSGTSQMIEIDGVHDLVYRSVDLAGNQEGSKSMTIHIDRQSPTTSYTVDGERGVLISAVDLASGVNSTHVRIDGGAWSLSSGSTWYQAPENATMEYYSIDRAGNQEGVHAIDVSDLPMSKVDLTFQAVQSVPPAGQPIEISWTMGNASLVEKIEVLVDGQVYQTMNSTATSCTITGLGAGDHILTIKASDLGGNSTISSQNITVAAATTTGLPLDVNYLAIIGIVAVVGVGVFLVLRKKRA